MAMLALKNQQYNPSRFSISQLESVKKRKLRKPQGKTVLFHDKIVACNDLEGQSPLPTLVTLTATKK